MAPTITNYNISQVTEHSGNKLVKLLEFTSNPDPTTTSLYDYLPGIIILLSVFIVIFFSLKIRGFSTTATFVACSIANFVIALLIYPLGVISGEILVVSLVLVPIAGFLLFIQAVR